MARRGWVPALARAVALPRERLAHASQGSERLLQHEGRLEPQHPVAHASQSPVALRIGGAPRSMVAPVDLDHEPRGGRREVGSLRWPTLAHRSCN